MADLLAGLHVLFAPLPLLLIVLGTVVGIIGGALPGITPTVAVALLLPLTYGMPPAMALIALGAVYMAAEYGGSISGILINTPGSAGAIATALDGHPLARQGRAQDALLCSINGSSIGGIFGTICLLLFTPPLARLSLRFGPPEMFWLAIAGLSIICSLTAKDFSKGVIAAAIGLWISTIGADPISGAPRFTYGSFELQAGISLIPALLGFFSITQMLLMIANPTPNTRTTHLGTGRFRHMLKFIFSRPVLLLRSSIIGVIVGLLPGAGASIASFISYGEAQRVSKEPESFGQGNPEGVIASETANNAMVGGSLMPLLTFGIPGSPSAAVLFGALAMNGMIPGPRLMVENVDVVYPFMLSFFPAVICMYVMGTIGARFFPKVLEIKDRYIIPSVLVLTLIGSYAVRGSLLDLAVTAGCGVLGLLLKQANFKLAPVVLGIILGPMAEQSYWQAMSIADAHGSALVYFFERPICVVLILITLVMVILPLLREFRLRRSMATP